MVQKAGLVNKFLNAGLTIRKTIEHWDYLVLVSESIGADKVAVHIKDTIAIFEAQDARQLREVGIERH